MNIITLVHAFEAGIGLIFLVILCCNLWPSYRLDAFRQELFAVRDELFDYAAAGNIGFDDPAYKLLRKSMNGLIRYAHNLTFFRFVCTLIELKVLKAEEYDWSEKWTAALGNVRDGEVRNKLLDFHSRALQLALNRMVNGSAVLLVAIVLVSLISVVHQKWMGIRSLFQRSTSAIIDARIIEEEAAKCA